MKELNNYNIAFVGLSNGRHSFMFKVNEKFFENFEDAIITNSNVKVDFTFNKQQSHFELDFGIAGKVEVDCDRCSQLYYQPIDGQFKVYVKFEDDDTKMSDDADVHYISRGETHLDISRFVHDFITLSVPLKKVHPTDENGNEACDPEILKILNNKEEDIDAIDPRWAALKNLKDN